MVNIQTLHEYSTVTPNNVTANAIAPDKSIKIFLLRSFGYDILLARSIYFSVATINNTSPETANSNGLPKDEAKKK